VLPQGKGIAYVLHEQRRRKVLGDSCLTAACRCTWWICKSGGQSRAKMGQAPQKYQAGDLSISKGGLI
jgi:hypothetical protein